jgi:hypothetical protein
MRITKEQIIEAIKTESALVSGLFVAHGDFTDETTVAQATNCRVCAVGSLLKRKVPARFSLQRLNELCYRLVYHGRYDETEEYFDGKTVKEERADLIERKRWLDLLSCEFEHRMKIHNNDLKKVRPALIRFVRKNFPNAFLIKNVDLAA